MIDDVIKNQRDQFFEAVCDASRQALAEGIQANSIVINSNMVRVPETWIKTPIGVHMLPRMICGLNVYVTKDELPDGYSFAVLEGPENRLAQFEAIGMEPSELRKAAEIYRNIKETI